MAIGPSMNRRSFIVSSSSLIAGGLLLSSSKARADTGALSVRATPGGALITPNGQFFVYSQMRTPAQLPSSIDIDGLVASPARYAVSELAAMPAIMRLMTLECFVNTAGGPLIFTSHFQGVPLAPLFEKAGIKANAKAAQIETSDGHPPFLLPLAELQRPSTMLVGKFGPDPVPVQHGSPYTRLFIPGAGGNHHPKWVARITFVETQASAHDSPPMAGFLSPAPPEARGSMSGVVLTGYAFTGPEPVGKVELSTDDGTTYQSMPLPPQPDPNVWLTWEITWRPPQPGFYVLRVRATSASGRKQDIPGVIAVQVG
jgi:DMSO/TMAO reductase YedYZ molybdopterin-dependent catalytic subunit